METILLEILSMLRDTGRLEDKRPDDKRLDDKLLAKTIRKHNKGLGNSEQRYAKKQLLPYYLEVKRSNPQLWASWDIDQQTEKRLIELLRVKPRRTASGVATITVLTKPWKCSSDCLYCPSDLRMPKSYLSDEPACQRAEMSNFDPYLQVASRLYVLTQMGHVTEKVELIVLGGTWSDYPLEYQIWFVTEMFRALNDAEGDGSSVAPSALGRTNRPLPQAITTLQQEVNSGALSYNQAVELLYGYDSISDVPGNNNTEGSVAKHSPIFDELLKQHTLNETALHRVVGLTIETRPDAIARKSLTLLRQLGCTKVQMGIQSLNPVILRMNNRRISLERIAESFELLRIFGFKIHVHFMVNLYGSSCDEDIRDYQRLVTETPYQPDEVKLYPCALVNGTGLCEQYAKGTWQPYSEQELLAVLIADTLATPPFIRISRMIRDISAHDIVAGNKKANLRQLVERRIAEASTSAKIVEIRYREIATSETDVVRLSLETLAYETTVTHEYFLQWVTPEYRITGFLRLSLPKGDYVHQHQSSLPVGIGEAMIREVHVYGKVAALHERAAGEGAQHLGLGRQLIDAACLLAKEQGYQSINVISSIGTREYYRSLGFYDNGLYQQRPL